MRPVHGNIRTTRTFPASNLQPEGRSGLLNFVYQGYVKDNRDAQRMGRLSVWIPELGGDPSDPDGWILVSYVSPFAGASVVDANQAGGTTYTQSQQAYGFWMVPPDIENEVIVAFLAGMPNRGVYLGTLYQQYMNSGVPGLASAPSVQGPVNGVNPPTVEYNKKNTVVAPDPPRPRFDPLHDSLQSQGLYVDPQRGPTDASSRRDTPGNVYGFITPQGHHIYIDDGPLTPIPFTPGKAPDEVDLRKRRISNSNQYIRLRTRSGVQLLLNDTSGYIYMITQKGNSWAEISDQGINLYSNQDLRMRANNIYMRADKNFSLEVGGVTNWANNDDVNFDFGNNFNTRVNMKKTDYVTGDITVSTQSVHTTEAATQIIRSSPIINDNNTPVSITPMQTIPTHNEPDQGGTTTTIIPEGGLLTHESWRYHLVGAYKQTAKPDTPLPGQKSAFPKGGAFPGAQRPANVYGSPSNQQPPGVYTPPNGAGYDANGDPILNYQGPVTGTADPSTMSLSPNGEAFIKQREGTGPIDPITGNQLMYNDQTGKAITDPNIQGATIGYGHLLTPAEKASGTINIGGQPIDYSQGLTPDQANTLFTQDSQVYANAVRNNTKVPLTQNQFDALTSFSYGVGPSGYKNSTLLSDLNSGNYSQATSDFGLYVHSQGKVNNGLINRQAANASLFSAPPPSSP